MQGGALTVIAAKGAEIQSARPKMAGACAGGDSQ
jgi:hypothetical protein